MSKYAPLGDYLRDQDEIRVGLSFADIERVIGSKLPPSAFEHRAWWSNNPENNVATKEWRAAGYVTEDVSLENKTVVFRRREEGGVAEAATKGWGGSDVVNPRAHEGISIHPLFGAHKGKIHIMPGTDLTEPADPEWGKIWDE